MTREKKIYEVGESTILAYSGRADVAEMAQRRTVVNYELSAHNSPAKYRRFLQGENIANRAGVQLMQVLNFASRELCNSMIVVSAGEGPAVATRVWRGPGHVEVNRSWGAIGSGYSYIKQYVASRLQRGLTGKVAEEMAVAAIKRARLGDLYSGGPIVVYHVNGSGRSAKITRN